MTLVTVIISVIIGAVIGVLADWLLKPLLPQHPTIKHGCAGIIFIIVLASATALLSNLPSGPTNNPTASPKDISSPAPSRPTDFDIPTAEHPPTIEPANVPTPVSYDVNNPDYSVQLAESAESSATVNLFIHDSPMVNQHIQVVSLQKNVANDLYCDDRGFSQQYDTDRNGKVEIGALPPGLYALFISSNSQAIGLFGVSLPSERNCPRGNTNYGLSYGFVFPVQASKQTIVNIKLVHLEIGVIFNGEAQDYSRVTAKKNIPMVDEAWSRTDPSGKTVLMVGAGDYNICVSPLSSFNEDVCFQLSIPNGTTYVQEIIEMPYEAGR